MKNTYIPAICIADWKILVPSKQWKCGHSAKKLAYCWHEHKDFPDSVRCVFKEFSEPPFKNCKGLLVFPEHKVPLKGGKTPSQNDIWVLAKSGAELISITIEGKVSEGFGKTLENWLSMSNGTSDGKRKRLDYLKQVLDLKSDPDLSIRYQLLHRTASALIEADRFNAKNALMMVHSFSPENKGFEDYKSFVSIICSNNGININKICINKIVSAGLIKGVSLYFAWINEEKYLEK